MRIIQQLEKVKKVCLTPFSTTQNPATAYQTMRAAVDNLVLNSTDDAPMLLHILTKNNDESATALKQQLDNYILNLG